MDVLAGTHENSILNASDLDDATHCFRNRADMEIEAKSNHGGVAAYNA